jgi:hypothetical protein
MPGVDRQSARRLNKSEQAIDEELSIDGLLGVEHHPGSPSANMTV